MKSGTTNGKIMTAPAMTDDSFIHTIDIAPGVRAGFTCRSTITTSPHSGINMCHYTGDEPGHVAYCRDRFSKATGIPQERIIIPRQTHSADCAVIDRIPVEKSIINGVDALVTTLTEVIIGVSTADCVPVVLADADNGVIGVAHAGWRGALAGVTDNAVDAMLRCGACIDNIKAAMGPCICPDCFEVGEEVAENFPDRFIVRGFAKPHVDLPLYVKSRLEARGIAPSMIKMPPACTRCAPDIYFSARALGINSGRIYTFITLDT